MCRRGVGVMAAALVWGGLAAAIPGQVHAEDIPPAPMKTGGWWGVWFKDSTASKPAAKPAAPATPAPASTPPAAPAAAAPAAAPVAAIPAATTPVNLSADSAAVLPASTVLQQAAEALERENQAYLRRVEVCDRLREVAQETGNTELENQANVLADQAGKVWEQRTARLPRRVPTGRPAPLGGSDSERSPKGPGQLPRSQKVGGGTVTGEEKP